MVNKRIKILDDDKEFIIILFIIEYKLITFFIEMESDHIYSFKDIRNSKAHKNKMDKKSHNLRNVHEIYKHKLERLESSKQATINNQPAVDELDGKRVSKRMEKVLAKKAIKIDKTAEQMDKIQNILGKHNKKNIKKIID